VDGLAAIHTEAIELGDGLLVLLPALLRAGADGAAAASIQKRHPARHATDGSALIADFGATPGGLENGMTFGASALRDERRNTPVNNQVRVCLPEVRVGLSVALATQGQKIVQDVRFNVGTEKLEWYDVVNLQWSRCAARLAFVAVALLCQSALLLPVAAAIPSVTTAPCRIRRAAKIILAPLAKAFTTAKRTLRHCVGRCAVKLNTTLRANQFHALNIATIGT
jgi:hypothetical protein